MRSRYSGTPFTSSTAEIAAALEDVSIPTLLLSLVHVTGDTRFIEEFRQNGVFLNEIQGFMAEDDKARARAAAVEVICAYRDQGCPEPKPLDPLVIKRMIDWAACEEVGAEYLPMVMDELDLASADPRRPTRIDPDAADNLPVLVIGCGESGLLAAIRLKQAGLPFVVVEKNAGPGGTWFENSYPGARVDVANHFYSYSFEPGTHWTHYFAEQPELQAYFNDVLDKHQVNENVRWNTEVLSAVWLDHDGVWAVTVRSSDGTSAIERARAVICAVGQLNRPNWPDIPGAGSFAGPIVHSAAWDHGIDLAGRNVAMIGAGASGFQLAPAIADQVATLNVFQRSAQWMFPNPMYHDAVGAGTRWAMEHLPFYGRWYRLLVLWPGADKGLDAARVNPTYANQDYAVSEINAAARMMFTDWITNQVGDDDELLDRVLPDYPATGKRTLQDNGTWLRTLRRDNVELVRTGIEHITETGVRTVDGREYPADVIIYATGFRATDLLWPMTITGRDGLNLHEAWGEKPYAYRGVTVPQFPNFFIMYGPGAHLAHGGSLIFNSELQMRYIGECLSRLSEGMHSIEPTNEATEAWHQASQAAIKQMVWAHRSIEHSYFKNNAGEIHTVSPWRLCEYEEALRDVAWSDYRCRPLD